MYQASVAGADRFGERHELVGVGHRKRLPEHLVDLLGERLRAAARSQQPDGDPRVEGEPVDDEPGTAQRLELRLGVEEVLRRAAARAIPRARW